MKKSLVFFVIIITVSFSCKKENIVKESITLTQSDTINCKNKNTTAPTPNYSRFIIQTGVFDILRLLTQSNETNFSLTADFHQDLDFDPLEMSTLKTLVENKFNCTLSYEKFEQINTVGDLIDNLCNELIIDYNIENKTITNVLIHFGATDIDEFIDISYSYKVANNENGTKFSISDLKSSLASSSSYVKDNNTKVTVSYTPDKTQSRWDEFTNFLRFYAKVTVTLEINGIKTKGVCNIMLSGIINANDYPIYDPETSIEYGDVTYVYPDLPPSPVKDTTGVFSKMKLIISDHLANPEVNISKNSKFTENLGCDYLDLWEIVFNVEDEFNIEIPDIVYQNLHTVGDLYNYIVLKL
jgi:acyl carrier protein